MAACCLENFLYEALMSNPKPFQLQSSHYSIFDFEDTIHNLSQRVIYYSKVRPPNKPK